MKYPALLDFPKPLMKLITEFGNHRYFLISGGRASGKSQSVCRLALYLGEHHQALRILFLREFQNTLAESLHQLLSDTIRHHNLDWTIQREKIMHNRTKTVMSFRGIRESGAFNLQGCEGVDLVISDESQVLSPHSIRVLLPTIRKPNSRLIFVMNRFKPDDAIVTALSGRPDCLEIECNYLDNHHLPKEMLIEAQECRKRSESEYLHVWENHPLDVSDDALFSVTELKEAEAKEFPLEEGYGTRVAAFDPSRYGQDFSAITILEQRSQNHWQLIKTFEWQKMDLNYSTGRLKQIIKEYDVSKCACDIDGLGSGPYDVLTAGHRLEEFIPFSNVKISHNDYANQRTKNFYELKDMLRNGHIALPGCKKLITELGNIRFTFDSSQRRILVSKEAMKKKGIPSPNLADALAMSLSAINEVREEQDATYQTGSYNMPRYSQIEDPFPTRRANDR